MTRGFQQGSRTAHKKQPIHPSMIELKPIKRADGSAVTIRNCAAHECRWPYGLPDPDMMLCGRQIEKGPYCAVHRALVSAGKGGRL